MKNLRFLFQVVFVLTLTIPIYGQNVAIYDEMLNFLNQGNDGDAETNAFHVIRTNNTIRTGQQGVYQYAAYGESDIQKGCFRVDRMTIPMRVRFSDRNGFSEQAADDELWVIFKENNAVKIRVTHQTWGNATFVISSGIELIRTDWGGYAMIVKSTNAFSTFTFTRSKGGCIP